MILTSLISFQSFADRITIGSASRPLILVPVTLPQYNLTVDVPDLFLERRLPDDQWSAIHHAKLPLYKSAILPGTIASIQSENGRVLTESDVYSYRTQTQLWYDYIYWPGGYAGNTLFQIFYWVSSSTFRRVTVRGGQITGSTRCRLLISSVQDYIVGQAVSSLHGTRVQTAIPTVTSSFGSSQYFEWDAVPSAETVRDYIQATVPTLTVTSTSEAEVVANSTVIRSNKTWSTDQVVNWVHQVAIRSSKFEDDNLVRSVNWLEKVHDPLDPVPYWKHVRHTSYESPLWIYQDIRFLTGTANAYYNALSDMKRVNSNTLQNLAEAYSVLTSFAFDPKATASIFDTIARQSGSVGRSLGVTRMADFDPIFGKFQNAWLGGRYTFGTSVMDGREAYTYFNNKLLQYMRSIPLYQKCNGVYIDDENVTFRVCFRMQEKSLSGIWKFYQSLFKYGLDANAAVLWDFVPFSFVVDWFFPVSDAATADAYRTAYSPLYYEYLTWYGGYSMCFSVEYDVDTVLGQVHHYTRWYSNAIPELESSYVLLANRDATSDQTALFRALDGMALFLF